MRKQPILWVPSLYLAEGLPYAAVMSVSTLLMSDKGISNEDLAIYTSWFYLPWLIKPLWGPLVEMMRRKRILIAACQILMGGTLASVALSLPADGWLAYSIAAFWLAAFMSATHDIAADGFYIDALSSKQQSAWVGARSAFYKIAMVMMQGGLVVLAGCLKERYGVNIAWQSSFALTALVLALLGIYHLAVLPKTAEEQKSAPKDGTSIWAQLKSYFCKDNIGLIILFLTIFRLGESQLSKLSVLFLSDAPEEGGLGLSLVDVGVINGTFGVISMIAGGILGGLLISAQGLRKWIVPMALALNVPDVLYLLMSWLDIRNAAAVTLMISVEQLGYGFGFAAYSVFMLNISKGQYSTSHYSISTAFMALGMMLPGMISGWVQSQIGYSGFFAWVLACCVPSIAIAIIVRKRMLNCKD